MRHPPASHCEAGDFFFQRGKMAAKVILIRHGDTGTAWRERFIGSTDASLSPQGLRESSLLAGPLLREAAVKCLSSPALRARETAGAALSGTSLLPELESDLREIDFGDWEGKTFEEIQAAAPDAVSRWARYLPDFVFPGGEALAAFVERVERAGRRIAADPAEAVAVFTHAGVIRALICHYLGLDHGKYLYFKVGPASLTTIEIHDGGGMLTCLNDRCHLNHSRRGKGRNDE